jgi:hypothetical protein
MMCSKRHLPDIEQWSKSSGPNIIPRRARPGLAGLGAHRQVYQVDKHEREYGATWRN